jgi:hypothetical protein
MGKCPNCGAKIIFPRIGPPPTEPAPATPLTFIDPDFYWSATGWAAVAVVALCGISAWIWVRLIIFLAYGYMPYRIGLRVAPVGKLVLPFVRLNNGDDLSLSWSLVFISGFLTTWALLARGTNYLVERYRPRGRMIALIILVGLLAWISLLMQAMPSRYLFPVHFGESPARQGFMCLMAIFAAGGVVVWRDLKGATNAEQDVELHPHDPAD